MRTLAGLALFVMTSALSAQDMPLSQVLIGGEPWRTVPLPEGKPGALAADSSGNLFVAEAGGKRIWKVDPAGKATAFASTSASVGRLCVGLDGQLVAALPVERRLVTLDGKGKESALADKVAADDLAVSPSGKVVTLDSAKKAVVLVGREGPIAEGIGQPAGLAFWTNGGTLVVGDAAGKHLFAFRVKQDGGLDSKEGYYTLRVRRNQPSKVAALVLDDARRLYAATAEGVQVFDPTGRMSGVMNSPEREPVTALVFAGENRAQLYIVCAGKLWARKTKAKGVWPPAK